MKIVALLLGCLLLLGGEEQYIDWREDQPLSWEDFVGDVDPSSEMKAWTYSTLHMSWYCQQGDFHFDVVARFHKQDSWKKKAGSAALLAHEQLHFDIAELYARKMRRHFAVMPDACGLSEEEIRSHTGALSAEWRAYQARYDTETNHSMDHAAQQAWENTIARELKALERYALP